MTDDRLAKVPLLFAFIADGLEKVARVTDDAARREELREQACMYRERPHEAAIDYAQASRIAYHEYEMQESRTKGWKISRKVRQEKARQKRDDNLDLAARALCDLLDDENDMETKYTREAIAEKAGLPLSTVQGLTKRKIQKEADRKRRTK